ncbi:hypothetical protein HDU97_002618 [Phlyctochytrium planicorne]|nr:hypothetical protein HDU97_002618 [Phlyctochytrium planicorne]
MSKTIDPNSKMDEPQVGNVMDSSKISPVVGNPSPVEAKSFRKTIIIACVLHLVVKRLTTFQGGFGNAYRLSACDYVVKVAKEYYNHPEEAGNFCELDNTLPNLVYTEAAFAGATVLALVYFFLAGITNVSRIMLQVTGVSAVLAAAFVSSSLSVVSRMLLVPEFTAHADTKVLPYAAFYMNGIAFCLFLACAIIILVKSRHHPITTVKQLPSSYQTYGQLLPMYVQPQAQIYSVAQQTGVPASVVPDVQPQIQAQAQAEVQAPQQPQYHSYN